MSFVNCQGISLSGELQFTGNRKYGNNYLIKLVFLWVIDFIALRYIGIPFRCKGG